jgi:hypothetical protein
MDVFEDFRSFTDLYKILLEGGGGLHHIGARILFLLSTSVKIYIRKAFRKYF